MLDSAPLDAHTVPISYSAPSGSKDGLTSTCIHLQDGALATQRILNCAVFSGRSVLKSWPILHELPENWDNAGGEWTPSRGAFLETTPLREGNRRAGSSDLQVRFSNPIATV